MPVLLDKTIYIGGVKMVESFLKEVKRNGNSLAINIPKDVVKLMELKKGNVVRVSIEDAKQ